MSLIIDYGIKAWKKADEITGYTLTVDLYSWHGYSSVTVEHGGGTQTTYPESTTSIADVTKIISVNYGGQSVELLTVNGSSVSFPYILTQNSALVGEFSCLTGDTLITMSDNTTKRIDEMEVGDCFLRYNFETQSLEEDTVSYTDSKMNKTASEYDVWTFDDGTIIKTVHRHEFYNVELESMEYMDKWEIGQHTYKIDGTTQKLIKHKTIKEMVKHYSLKGKKTYTSCFANNLLTGNRHSRGKKIILNEWLNGEKK